MNKFDELASHIQLIPDELYWIKHALNAQLESGRLESMVVYALGLWHMAEAMTSDESILTPIREIRRILK